MRPLRIGKPQQLYIVISDLLGKEIARYLLHEGENEVKFEGSEFNPQVFFCTLVINGTKIKTNKIVKVK